MSANNALTLELLEKKLSESVNKTTRNLLTVQNRLYAQLESLSWLQHVLQLKGALPPLRGWAASPDVLLRLHTHIRSTQPSTVVEFGSGASTLVIADALRQNQHGKLISLEHSEYYGQQARQSLVAESLQSWVDLRIGELEPWQGPHLSPANAEKPVYWYSVNLLQDIEQADLVFVDGPPGKTCLYSRYPAVPALINKLPAQAEIWLDDTVRQEEKDTCESWAKEYGFELSFYPLEKGLGRLIKKPLAEYADTKGDGQNSVAVSRGVESDYMQGFDFSLDDKYMG